MKHTHSYTFSWGYVFWWFLRYQKKTHFPNRPAADPRDAVLTKTLHRGIRLKTHELFRRQKSGGCWKYVEHMLKMETTAYQIIPKIMTRILWTSRFGAETRLEARNRRLMPRPKDSLPSSPASAKSQIWRMRHSAKGIVSVTYTIWSNYSISYHIIYGKARKRYKSKILHFIFVEITDQNVFICAPQPTQGARRLQRPQRTTFARSFSGRPELSNTCELVALTSVVGVKNFTHSGYTIHYPLVYVKITIFDG